MTILKALDNNFKS